MEFVVSVFVMNLKMSFLEKMIQKKKEKRDDAGR
jgi:hypothetical protein